MHRVSQEPTIFDSRSHPSRLRRRDQALHLPPRLRLLLPLAPARSPATTAPTKITPTPIPQQALAAPLIRVVKAPPPRSRTRRPFCDLSSRSASRPHGYGTHTDHGTHHCAHNDRDMPVAVTTPATCASNGPPSVLIAPRFLASSAPSPRCQLIARCSTCIPHRAAADNDNGAAPVSRMLYHNTNASAEILRHRKPSRIQRPVLPHALSSSLTISPSAFVAALTPEEPGNPPRHSRDVYPR
ncbi:hypothetical protein K438DRAFT_1987626 [Mycena galopus ATCC 62051]|nr:hypothetical protein K438DRAFT_1987626 [Mycena galopus ATCC 62051]